MSHAQELHRRLDRVALELGADTASEVACIQVRALAEWLAIEFGYRDAYEIFQAIADTLAGPVCSRREHCNNS